MIIKNIPESVYKRALELRGECDTDIPDGWSYEKELRHREDASGFSNLELEKAIAEYLLETPYRKLLVAKYRWDTYPK